MGGSKRGWAIIGDEKEKMVTRIKIKIDFMADPW